MATHEMSCASRSSGEMRGRMVLLCMLDCLARCEAPEVH